ncbi:MAG TPA: hypothetical protein VGK06_07670 [Methanosarcina sp.]
MKALLSLQSSSKFYERALVYLYCITLVILPDARPVVVLSKEATISEDATVSEEATSKEGVKVKVGAAVAFMFVAVAFIFVSTITFIFVSTITFIFPVAGTS